jgi:hypothetical protein
MPQHETKPKDDRLIVRARFRAMQIGYHNLTDCLRIRAGQPDSSPADQTKEARRIIANIRNGLGQTQALFEASDMLDIPRDEAVTFWFADDATWTAKYNPTMAHHQATA